MSSLELKLFTKYAQSELAKSGHRLVMYLEHLGLLSETGVIFKEVTLSGKRVTMMAIIQDREDADGRIDTE